MCTKRTQALIRTLKCSYLPKLPPPMAPEGARPLPGKFLPGTNPETGLVGADSPLTLVSRRHLALSLVAISARASLATTWFPDI